MGVGRGLSFVSLLPRIFECNCCTLVLINSLPEISWQEAQSNIGEDSLIKGHFQEEAEAHMTARKERYFHYN